MKELSKLDKIHRFFVEHWFITFLSITVTSYWFNIIQIAGKNLGLYDSNGNLVKWCYCCFWFILIISLLFIFLKSFYDFRMDKINTKSRTVLQDILSSTNSITNKKADRFKDYILNQISIDNTNPFIHITKPHNQIKDLAEELTICLHKFLGVKRESISVSIIYKTLFEDEKWKWLHKSGIHGCLGIGELTTHPKSAIKLIINRTENQVFMADKRTGYKKGEYLPDNKDKEHNNIGSLLSKNISVEIDDQNYLFAILNIATYGIQICEETDLATKEVIIENILPPFEIRFKLELALFYIKEYQDFIQPQLKKVSSS
jgi:phenylpyruvate tautomerase PptA (4-oxalocrotonate tautomerase family)